MAATTTTIKGVQILTRKRARRADVFDITLSVEGIDVVRPGRTAQHMGWDRVSHWEIEERPGYVVLTLRGDGAVTPLVVRGWTLDGLEAVMRDVTEASPRTVSAASAMPGEPAPRTGPAEPAPPVAPAGPAGPGTATAATAAAAPATATPSAAPRAATAAATTAPATTAPATTAPATPEPVAAPASPGPRAERREQQRRSKQSGVPWKAIVTVVLLGLLATAVTLVLLQSAGIISWGPLGPTA